MRRFVFALRWLELRRRRRIADEWLLWGAVPNQSSELLSWRAAELTSPRMRSTLAGSLRRLEREVSNRRLPGPVPLNTRALRDNLVLLGVLHRRIDDRSRSVAPRGMLLVDRLLTESGSPLYSRVASEILTGALSDALAALEPDRTHAHAA